ncbi:hypothetical protein F4805DRAFT_472308 [Annulohypoxylon moriforme]|nr:hypothetical protein F4805DRAFT_472308 [Annulohypoxylon moriforme]
METHGNYSLKGNPLKLDEMQGLPVINDERKRKIVGRCNWYMFTNSETRGHIGHTIDFFKLRQTAARNYPPEQEMPNEELARNPPTVALYDKYFTPFPRSSEFWFTKQDLVSANAIRAVLERAWKRWQTISTRATQVQEAIKCIPKPELINKVVCVGLGPILTALRDNPGGGIEDHLAPRNVAQHCLAIAIVKQLEEKTGSRIRLYTADPGYTRQHKIALEGNTIIPFTVLDPHYGWHEQFTVIDDNTMLINFAGPPDCPTMRIIEEYARPAVIITREVPRIGPYQNRQWFEVTEKNGNKLKMPGCADLPLPDGINIGTLCPKRVRDMMVNEYKIESKFPAEDPNLEWSWGKNELVEYGSRDNFSASGGYYWYSDVRMYVRNS